MLPNRIKRPEARLLAETEFVRFAELAASLSDEEWATPTDCTASSEGWLDWACSLKLRRADSVTPRWGTYFERESRDLGVPWH